ncbi:MAG: EVE domain-containing protein [Myxococcaceae bacterium]|nr:EVE domain-containing protein [Myxococcaceae bacterium]
MAYWHLKSEPSTYSFAQLQKEKRTEWTGVRNYQARLNLRAMKPGDTAIFFHTGDEKMAVGIAKILTGPEADPTAKGEDWTKVDIAAVKALAVPVPLAQLKKTAALKKMALVTSSRLSVGPVTPAEMKAVLALAKTKL